MSNLALGQTAWNRFMRELGLWLAMLKCLRNESRRFNAKRNRTQILEINDTLASTSEWTLSGVKIGTNTNEDGILYVRITDETPGAGQATVDLYKATGGGGGDKVATGSGANGATIALAAANSSGLTGTVKLAAIGASESNDLHRLQVFPDWGLRAPIVWDNTNTADPESNRIFLATLPRVESLVELGITQVENGLREWLATRWAQLMQSGQTSPIDTATELTDGLVEITYTGLLEDGRVNMRDEGTPAAQTIVKNVVASGAGSFDSQNQGAGAMAAPSMEEWARPGTLSFSCVDSTIGAEEFSAALIDAVTGEAIQSERNLRVKKTFADPILGVRAAVLTRSMALTSGISANFSTTMTDHNITGETADNTNDGVLYLKIVAGTVDPAKFCVEFYKASTYGTSEIVGRTDEGAANATVAINERKTSGLGGSFKLGSGPTAGHTGTLNLKVFKTKNTNGVPDKFEVAVTVTSRGEFQDHIAQSFQYALNSAASGAETIDDSYVSAGTFPAFEVRDV